MGLPDAFDDLRDKRMWVAWADEGGRKVPKSPHGGNARSNDPSTWGTYAEAEAARAKNGYSGVGLMLTDGYIGIDLDGAVEDGAIADWAQEIIDGLDSYAELSPSGTGVHVIGWSNVEQVGPIGRNNRRGVEVYNHGRYFTVTGDAVNDAPIMDVTPDIEEFIYAHFPGESPDQAIRRRVGNLARDQVKRMANRTMAENCARDGVRYARVPRGTETCGFCLMLASRGFAYTTPEAAQHSHDGCDCKVVPGFEDTEVEGYDLSPMLDAYSDCCETLGGRQGIRRMWDALPDDERTRRIAKHGGSESDAFDSFAARQVSKEIETRDPEWFRTGKAPEVDYSLSPREERGRLASPGDYSDENIIEKGNEWRDLFAIDTLQRGGFRISTRPSKALGSDGAEVDGVTCPDINIGDEIWEIKSPPPQRKPVKDGNELDYIGQQMRRAKHNFSNVYDPDLMDGVGEHSPKKVVLNLYYHPSPVPLSSERFRNKLVGEMRRYGIDEVLVIDGDGSMMRFFKK